MNLSGRSLALHGPRKISRWASEAASFESSTHHGIARASGTCGGCGGPERGRDAIGPILHLFGARGPLLASLEERLRCASPASGGRLPHLFFPSLSPQYAQGPRAHKLIGEGGERITTGCISPMVLEPGTSIGTVPPRRVRDRPGHGRPGPAALATLGATQRPLVPVQPRRVLMGTDELGDFSTPPSST